MKKTLLLGAGICNFDIYSLYELDSFAIKLK
jgi:hypothetical protein